MSTYFRIAVLWTVTLAAVFGSMVASEVKVISEEELSTVVAKNQFVLVLYSPVLCTSAECENINKQFPVIVESLASHKVIGAVVKNVGETRRLDNNKEPKLIFYRNTVPILFDALPANTEEVLSWIKENMQSYVLSLNDDNFEHETQASTGATTGDWFIRFYTRSCEDSTPVWEAVASTLHTRINVASVDTESSGKLEKRFRITHCPTFILFRHGNMYTYELSVMTVHSFVSFADGWYKNARSQPVPTELTPFDALTDSIVDILKTTLESANMPLWPAAVIFLMSVAAILVLCCLRTSDKRKKSD